MYTHAVQIKRILQILSTKLHYTVVNKHVRSHLRQHTTQYKTTRHAQVQSLIFSTRLNYCLYHNNMYWYWLYLCVTYCMVAYNGHHTQNKNKYVKFISQNMYIYNKLYNCLCMYTEKIYEISMVYTEKIVQCLFKNSLKIYILYTKYELFNCIYMFKNHSVKWRH